MSAARDQFEQTLERLQQLLTALEGVGDSAARSAVREFMQVALGLHRQGLAELLEIVADAGSQPADILLPRFLANPAVRGLLLLHDLHPLAMPARVTQAVERLRPHFGVHGLRVDLLSLEKSIVRLRVSVTAQNGHRPDAGTLQREIETAVLELAPDAAGIVIEGLEAVRNVHETVVPLSSILVHGQASHCAPPGGK